MHNIPIVVSRVSQSGKKQIYTVRDSITNDQNLGEFYRPSELATVEAYRQKQHKVRIRRIQSSGSKRKFPRDFFSRESNRPSRNSTLKERNNINCVAQQTACFATINDPIQERESVQNQPIETPKFKQKLHTDRIVMYKNQTLKETIRKFINKKDKQIRQADTKQSPKKNEVMSFQNTFSGAQFKTMGQQCNQIDLNAIFKPDKQNLPLKRIKATKQSLLKKFSLLKQKSNNLKNRNKKQ